MNALFAQHHPVVIFLGVVPVLSIVLGKPSFGIHIQPSRVGTDSGGAAKVSGRPVNRKASKAQVSASTRSLWPSNPKRSRKLLTVAEPLQADG